MTSVDDCRTIELPKIADDRGNLTFAEGDAHIPFEVRRVYWIYDVPGGGTRGGHAYRDLQEVVVALSGSFDVVVQDGRSKRTISLNRSYNGLFLPQMMWRNMVNFSTNAVCLVLASAPYDESDYVRDTDRFLELKGCGGDGFID